MESFTRNFTLIEGITITISLIAIFISLLSYYDTNKRDKRQLRVNKIEEMIEIVILILDNYASFDDLFCLQEKIRSISQIDDLELEKKALIEKEKKYISLLYSISNDVKFREKIIRLNVLASSYLPNNELKYRVKALVGLISNIYESTVNQNYSQTKRNFITYPRAWTLMDFTEKLILDLSKEMNLGYESNFFGKNPYDEKFMNELGIK
jgi:hypothetical protein